MAKPTITRERLQEIAEDGFLKHGESKELARMALAAMESEADCKERKLFCSTDTARMRKVISVSAGTGDAPLYRHAQPVPVVLDAIDTNLIEALRLVQCMLDDYRERNYGDAQGWIRHINMHMSDYTEAHGDDAYSVLHNLITAAPQSPGSEPATVPGKWIPVSERMPEDRTQVILWDAEIGEVTSGHYSHKTQTFYHCGDAIENEITHWMLPPSAPQGVKP